MSRCGHHEAVADADGERANVDDREPAEGAEGAEALQVEVEEDAAVVVEDEIAERVGALDGEAVGEPVLEEPGVLERHELERRGVVPEVVGPIGRRRVQAAHLVSSHSLATRRKRGTDSRQVCRLEAQVAGMSAFGMPRRMWCMAGETTSG